MRRQTGEGGWFLDRRVVSLNCRHGAAGERGVSCRGWGQLGLHEGFQRVACTAFLAPKESSEASERKPEEADRGLLWEVNEHGGEGKKELKVPPLVILRLSTCIGSTAFRLHAGLAFKGVRTPDLGT